MSTMAVGGLVATGDTVVQAGWLALHAAGRGREPQSMPSWPERAEPRLPRADHVLAITARPGQESTDLGAVLYTLGRAGARLALLSLTGGDGQEMDAAIGRPESARSSDLQVAAGLLGIASVSVAGYPDGRLSACAPQELAGWVRRAIAEQSADLLLVTDPAESGLDEAVVAMAACAAAEEAGVPALARTVSTLRGGWRVDLGELAAPARAAQRSAVAAHASQAGGPGNAFGALQLGRSEWLRWLVPPAAPLPLLH